MIAGAVGDAAEMGVIAATLGIDHATKTPLEEKLEILAGLISKFGYAMAILICSTLVIRGILVGDLTGLNLVTANHLLKYFMLAVVIVVAAVPEGLPMSVALSLSLAMRKMTRANCLVRRLIACETIGSATSICTDKTGTLTKNQMEVAEASITAPDRAGPAPRNPCGMDHAERGSQRHRAPRRAGEREGDRDRELDRGCAPPVAAGACDRLPGTAGRYPGGPAVPFRREAQAHVDRGGT